MLGGPMRVAEGLSRRARRRVVSIRQNRRRTPDLVVGHGVYSIIPHARILVTGKG